MARQSQTVSHHVPVPGDEAHLDETADLAPHPEDPGQLGQLVSLAGDEVEESQPLPQAASLEAQLGQLEVSVEQREFPRLQPGRLLIELPGSTECRLQVICLQRQQTPGLWVFDEAQSQLWPPNVSQELELTLSDYLTAGDEPGT